MLQKLFESHTLPSSGSGVAPGILFAVGEAMALNPRLTVKHGDLGSDVREKHLKMSLMVSEYLEKAKNLIAHASEGVFP
jgi:hypothetical protein